MNARATGFNKKNPKRRILGKTACHYCASGPAYKGDLDAQPAEAKTDYKGYLRQR